MKTFFFLLIPIILFGCRQEQETRKVSEEISATTKKDSSSKKKTTYYFIRHAEKDRNASTEDPHLLPKGKERAQRWAEILKDKNIDLVYSTNFSRTRETAMPTASMVGTKVRIYNTKNLYSKKFRKETEGKNVLVVGHTDTTPAFINEILGEEKYKDIPDDNNGNLYVVTLHPNGKKEASVKRYED